MFTEEERKKLRAAVFQAMNRPMIETDETCPQCGSKIYASGYISSINTVCYEYRCNECKIAWML